MTVLAQTPTSPFPSQIAFAVVAEGDDVDDASLPEELAALSPTCVARRRREFVCGRAAAHRALQLLLGRAPGAVGKGAHGEPLWPAGVVGALTHSAGLALAAVGRAVEFCGLGLDLERVDRRVTPGIASRIGSSAEQRWIEAGGAQAKLRLLMLFSAKESLFKACFPCEHVFLGYRDAELRWDEAQQAFRGRLLVSAGRALPAGYELTVGCRLLDELVLTHCVLPARSPAASVVSG